jgi:hypothetical protein
MNKARSCPFAAIVQTHFALATDRVFCDKSNFQPFLTSPEVQDDKQEGRH